VSNTVALDKTLNKNKKRSVKRRSGVENNFAKYVEIFRKLLLLNEKNDLATTLKNIQELMSFSEKIFSSSAVSESFLYFCLHGAATAWVLQCELNMPEATVYRALKRLRAMGVVLPALKVSKVQRSKGGPRPTVWAIDTATPDEVSTALKHHYRMLSPKFRVAEEVAQTILDEFSETGMPMEINYRDIMTQVKELKIPFKSPDIADLAAQYLHEKGIKVWR
jgi:predicted transcriptional regulator